MVRARLAYLALASSLAVATGCASSSGFHPFARLHQPCCPEVASSCGCSSVGSMSGFEGPVLVPPDGTIMPAPPPPPGSMVPSPTAPPPRIVPVPQASPSPYSPTGLRRIFSRPDTAPATIEMR